MLVYLYQTVRHHTPRFNVFLQISNLHLLKKKNFELYLSQFEGVSKALLYVLSVFLRLSCRKYLFIFIK